MRSGIGIPRRHKKEAIADQHRRERILRAGNPIDFGLIEDFGLPVGEFLKQRGASWNRHEERLERLVFLDHACGAALPQTLDHRVLVLFVDMEDERVH